jgi:hypothetical protein
MLIVVSTDKTTNNTHCEQNNAQINEKWTYNFGRKSSMEETIWKPKRRWEYNIKMILKKQVMRVWTGSGQGPVAGCCDD